MKLLTGRNVSLPGLLGTIDEDTGEIVGSAVRDAAGKVLILDEAQNISRSSVDALNSLLSHQWAVRVMGRKVRDLTARKGAYWTIRPSSNGFELKAKFAAIITGEHVGSEMRAAFIQRFVCMHTIRDFEEMADRVLGEIVIDHIPRPPRRNTREEPTSMDDYVPLAERIRDEIRQNPLYPTFHPQLESGYIVRAWPNVIRIVAHLRRCGFPDDKAEHDAMSWISPILYGYKTQMLTIKELAVHDVVIQGAQSYAAIIERLRDRGIGISQRTLQETAKKLTRLGFFTDNF